MAIVPRSVARNPKYRANGFECGAIDGESRVVEAQIAYAIPFDYEHEHRCAEHEHESTSSIPVE